MSTTIRPAAVMSARVSLPFDPGRPLLLTRTLRRGVAGHAQAQTAMWGPCASCVIPYIQGREGQGWQERAGSPEPPDGRLAATSLAPAGSEYSLVGEVDEDAGDGGVGGHDAGAPVAEGAHHQGIERHQQSPDLDGPEHRTAREGHMQGSNPSWG